MNERTKTAATTRWRFHGSGGPLAAVAGKRLGARPWLPAFMRKHILQCAENVIPHQRLGGVRIPFGDEAEQIAVLLHCAGRPSQSDGFGAEHLRFQGDLSEDR